MRALAVLATAALVLTLVALGGLASMLLRGGMGARTAPPQLEVELAVRARRLGLRGSRTLRNPVSSSAETLAEGRAHFADHCASCHANDGSGQTELGQHLYPRAPDMRLSRTQQLSDGELFAIIEDGVRFTGMPAWGDKSEESQRASWQLVHFIRHLPSLTPEELLQMQQLNPKGADDRQEEQDEENFLNGEDPAPASATRQAGKHHH